MKQPVVRPPQISDETMKEMAKFFLKHSVPRMLEAERKKKEEQENDSSPGLWCYSFLSNRGEKNESTIRENEKRYGSFLLKNFCSATFRRREKTSPERNYDSSGLIKENLNLDGEKF